MAKQFGEILKDARKSRGMNRAELARLIGCSESSVFRYEQGQQVPGRQRYNRLLEQLNLPGPDYDKLFCDNSENGISFLLSEFWQKMSLGDDKACESLLAEIHSSTETEPIPKDVMAEIRLAKLLFLYRHYEAHSIPPEELLPILLDINGHFVPDADYFSSVSPDIFYSRLEIIGYNLYGLLLLESGNTTLPEIIFSSLLLHEKQKNLRDKQSRYREIALAGNLALCHYTKGAYTEALRIYEHYSDRIFHIGDVITLFYYMIMILCCHISIEDKTNCKGLYDSARRLYLKAPLPMRETISFDELLTGEKKGLLIFGN